ncbi:hypothetical protein L3Q82_020976 [Scortum barcoo]|uniref:Uncharacterized protein n=1 Tax=Scortum barcoo TaxID=214431 RepID=A0ACB8V948_9TELE|nr:hypothetical protein L3Q82_020976 [Scortum barcoo]
MQRSSKHLKNDLKRFGIAKVFSELLADLKSLETDGINVDGETVKGGLYCIAGDNLGSHFIGGFTENFSRSQYFCRYCEITRSEFEADPNACGPPRTTETYDAAVADLQADNIQNVRGIKTKLQRTAHHHLWKPYLPNRCHRSLFHPGSSSSTSASSPGLDTQWDDNFEIPWSKFPEEVTHALERGKRPGPKLRRQMVLDCCD